MTNRYPIDPNDEVRDCPSCNDPMVKAMNRHHCPIQGCHDGRLGNPDQARAHPYAALKFGAEHGAREK